MKIYVKTNTESIKPEKLLRIRIELEYGLEVHYANIAASDNNFDYSKYPVLNKKTKYKLKEDFDDFKETIIEMTNSMGFIEYESHQSNRNGSMSWYYSFIRETEFNILKVEYIFFMRVSDHILDENGFYRKDAEKKYRLNVANEARWMNPSLPEGVSIIPVPINISINSDRNYTYMNALDEVKKKLLRFRVDGE